MLSLEEFKDKREVVVTNGFNLITIYIKNCRINDIWNVVHINRSFDGISQCISQCEAEDAYEDYSENIEESYRNKLVIGEISN